MVNIVEQAIAQAMSQPDDRAMVNGIKSAVASHLRRLDPHATVTLTEFFNHTYVPIWLCSGLLSRVLPEGSFICGPPRTKMS